MNYQRIKTSVLALGLLMLAGQVSAQESNQDKKGKGHPSASQLISEMDADEDGQLSEDEVKGPLAKDFSTVDSDGDGYITEEELENAPKPKGRPQKD